MNAIIDPSKVSVAILAGVQYLVSNPYLVIVWSFKILITIVLALIYSFCFEDTVSLSILIKRHDFCQTPLYNGGLLQGLKVEQFPIYLL